MSPGPLPLLQVYPTTKAMGVFENLTKVHPEPGRESKKSDMTLGQYVKPLPCVLPNCGTVTQTYDNRVPVTHYFCPSHIKEYKHLFYHLWQRTKTKPRLKSEYGDF